MLRPLERVRVLPRSHVASSGVDALAPLPTPSPARVLDWDIENRPLTYRGYEKTSAEVTAIAWRFIGEPEHTRCFLLGSHTAEEMLTAFSRAWVDATMVTGHFIRGHDLGLVNAALIEYGLPTLSSKLTSDTCLDLVRFKELAKSQEALCAMFGIERPKVHMTQEDWRVANGRGGTITPEHAIRAWERVVGDVEQHIDLRRVLLQRGLLRPPRMWNPGGFRTLSPHHLVREERTDG